MIRSLACICLVLPSAALGQDKEAPLAFEVASVKPSGGQTRVIGLFTYPGGRITAENYTLKMLIHEAYAIEDYRIRGAPRWVETDRYNLDARPAASSTLRTWVPASFKTPPSPEMRQMLQSLLEERFKLKLHRETKKESISTLVVAKSGPKLSETKDANQQPFVSFLQHGLRGQNATMDLLVQRLAQIVKRPVLNRTELRGNFDFLIDYPPDDQEPDVEVLLLSALQRVGLKLETQPGSVDVIVIDHAEKPSPN